MKKEQFNRVLWNVRSSVLLCIAFLFVTGAFTAWAEQKEATIAIPYLDTVISEPVMLVDANDSILPASLPIAIAKFTKTVTLASQSVVVVYDTGDPLGTMALKDPANPPFPRGKNATLADLLVNIHQEGDGFVYDGSPRATCGRQCKFQLQSDASERWKRKRDDRLLQPLFEQESLYHGVSARTHHFYLRSD